MSKSHPYCPQCGKNDNTHREKTNDGSHYYGCSNCDLGFWITGWDNVE